MPPDDLSAAAEAYVNTHPYPGVWAFTERRTADFAAGARWAFEQAARIAEWHNCQVFTTGKEIPTEMALTIREARKEIATAIRARAGEGASKNSP